MKCIFKKIKEEEVKEDPVELSKRYIQLIKNEILDLVIFKTKLESQLDITNEKIKAIKKEASEIESLKTGN